MPDMICCLSEGGRPQTFLRLLPHPRSRYFRLGSGGLILCQKLSTDCQAGASVDGCVGVIKKPLSSGCKCFKLKSGREDSNLRLS
jgi:hypothetical protein